MKNLTNKSNRFIYGKIVLVIFLVFAGVLLSGCADQKAEQARRGMSDYLKNRYGTEFEVGKPYFSGDGYIRHYEAKAHPKGQSQIEFTIMQSWNDPNYYKDFDYLSAKWSYEGKLGIEKKIRQVYGEQVDFRVRYTLNINDYAYKDLDYAQVFEKTIGKGGTYLSYELFIDKASFDKNGEAEKAYEILRPFILDHGESIYYIFAVRFIEKGSKQKYLEKNDKSDDYFDELCKEGKVPGFLLVRPSKGDSIEINSGGDLVRYFKDLRSE